MQPDLYRNVDKMMAVDVTRDGDRFIMIKDESGAARLNVVLNWLPELTRIAPRR